jgi:hypothetical protein
VRGHFLGVLELTAPEPAYAQKHGGIDHFSPPTPRKGLVFPECQPPQCARHNPASTQIFSEAGGGGYAHPPYRARGDHEAPGPRER